MQSCTGMLDRKLRTPIFLGYLVPYHLLLVSSHCRGEALVQEMK
jgi:hypothetical protein